MEIVVYQIDNGYETMGKARTWTPLEDPTVSRVPSTRQASNEVRVDTDIKLCLLLCQPSAILRDQT